MKSKLGIQTQWDSGEALRYNMEVLPVAVMGINVAKSAWWSRLALDNPGVKRIYRHHPNSTELGLTKWADDPEGAALDFTAFLRGYLGDILNHIDLIAGDNEFILGPDHESPDRIEKADRFMAAFIQEAGLLLGKGVCVGNFNVGHWGSETVNYFPYTLATIQAQAVQGDRLSYFCFHEYNWPLLRDNDHWYTGKFLRAMPPILEQYPDVSCMITEIGVDKASRVWGEGHAGFRKTHDDINIAVEGYCGNHGLTWYNDLLNQTDYVAAALIFGCGMGDWRAMGFDIMNNIDDVAVLNHVKTYPVVTPPEPPANGGEPVIPDRVKIYDFDHGPGDEETASKEWLESIFGPCINVHPVTEIHQPQPGDIVYQLEWINCKPASTSCIIEVKDKDGNPAIGETVIFGWPTANTHGYSDRGWNWTINGAAGDTEEPDGHVGPALSTGSYYSPDQGECGAHFIWIWDHPSEMIDGVGMLPFHDDVPGANHLHTEYGFRAVVWGEEPPELPPVDGVLNRILTTTQENQALLQEIKEMLEDGYVPPGLPEPEVFYAEYFSNMALEGEPVLTRDEEAIDHFWGLGSPGIPVPSDYFSARWTGEFTFEEGTYEFIVLVDDGFRLWINELMRLETWKAQSPTEYRTTVTLPAGKHAIRAEYYEQAGGATCRLTWKKL